MKPSVINIDYNIDPKNKLWSWYTVQGGLDPNALLKDIDDMKKDALKYLTYLKIIAYINFNMFYHKQTRDCWLFIKQ